MAETGTSNFDVSLTVQLSITLVNDQLDAQIFNTFIIILYVYMFPAISCSSSGGQIVLIQHLVSSLFVSDRPVYRTVAYLLTYFVVAGRCPRPATINVSKTRSCNYHLVAPDDER
jgi:hypothetical protein